MVVKVELLSKVKKRYKKGWQMCIMISYQLRAKITEVIKPRRMREGYSSRFVIECVYYHASSYIPALHVQSEAAYSFL